MMRSDEPQRWVILVLVCAVLTCLGFEPAHGQAKKERDCTKAKENQLTLPTELPLPEYEAQLYKFILLNQRFSNVPDGPEGASRRRLYYLLSNLNVSGTPIEDWKLELVSATATQD